MEDLPDKDGGQRNHRCVEKRDKHDAHTVGVTQRSGIIEHGSDDDGTNHEKPVGHRHVKLSMESFGSVDDFELGKVRKLHDLRQKLETGGNDGLRSNNSGEDTDDQGVDQCAWRASIVDRVGVCLRVDADVCSLADVGQEETWQAETEPTESDSSCAECAQISKERFHTSEGEQDTTQSVPTLLFVSDQVFEGEARVEGLKDGGVIDGEVVNSEGGV